MTLANAEIVSTICRDLDGIPLAIELASARVSVLSVKQIQERLDRRFDLLISTTRADERHRILRAAIDWSYDLLSASERLLLQRLAVFTAGFALSTAESACAWGEIRRDDVLDLLSSFVSKSLVVAETLQGSEARYHLLETIRQYAQEKLKASGEWVSAHNHYLDCFLRLTEEVAPNCENSISSCGLTGWKLKTTIFERRWPGRWNKGASRRDCGSVLPSTRSGRHGLTSGKGTPGTSDFCIKQTKEFLYQCARAPSPFRPSSRNTWATLLPQRPVGRKQLPCVKPLARRAGRYSPSLGLTCPGSFHRFSRSPRRGRDHMAYISFHELFEEARQSAGMSHHRLAARRDEPQLCVPHLRWQSKYYNSVSHSIPSPTMKG